MSFNNIGGAVKKIQYPNDNYRMGLKNLENYIWICAATSDLDQVSVFWQIWFLWIMTVKKTKSRQPDKF